MEQPYQVPDPDEIDLVNLLQKVWNGRKIAIKISMLFTLLGVIIALNSTNMYTASTTFILKGKSSQSGGGNLSGLASLAGISVGSTSGGDSEIPPNLYPLLIKSNPFVEALLKINVPKDGIMIGLKDYLSASTSSPSFLETIKKYTLGLPSLIKESLAGNQDVLKVLNNTLIKRLTIKEEGVYNRTKELISLEIDKKEGFVTLSVIAENPELAAIIAQNAQNLLQQEVIDFKIKNAKESLTFTENLYAEKKIAFEALQDELAIFRDQHQNISSGLFGNKMSRLASELAIASAVNEELAKQVEQARIQVSKDTPIFTIIDPVIIPNQRTSPKRKLIVLGYAFFGFLFGLGYALIKEPFAVMRKQILEGKRTA